MESYPLTEEQIQFFRENGYLTLRGVFTEEEMAELREAAEALRNQRLDPQIEISQNDPEYEKIFVQKVNLWRIDERMRKFALHPRLGKIAAQLAGATMRIWHDHLLAKMPGDSKPTAWHQDIPYWPHTVGNQLGVWIPLYDVDEQSGCLGVIPRSHKLGLLPAHDFRELADVFQYLPESMRTPVWLPLKAGDCSVHHGLTLHGANANRSNRPRVAFAIFYMPDGTCYTGTGHVVTDGQGFEVGQPLRGELFPIVGEP